MLTSRIIDQQQERELTVTETALIRIWERLLRVASIKATDHFLSVGGDSLYAVAHWAQGREFLKAKSIADLARTHVVAIRHLQPFGPYRIAGCGFGGLVALETSQQLEAQGQEVEILFLLNPDPPQHTDTGTGRSGRAARVPGLDQNQPPLLRVEHIVAFLLAELRRRVPHGPYFLAGRCFGGFIGFEIAQQYRAKPFPGRIVLLRSEEFSKQPQKDHHLAWSTLALGGFECRDLPGNHMAIFDEPHVNELAAQIEASISSFL